MNNFKRIAALAAVIIWVLLILATLVCAFIPSANSVFKGLIFTDIALPIVIYVLMMLYKLLNKNNGEE